MTGSHQQVLELMHCADLDELVPADFLAEYGLESPGQYGMVSRNVAGAVRDLEAAGAGPFIHATSKGPNWCEWGEPKDVMTELAMGYTNQQQIEVLGPGQGTTFYTDGMPEDDGIALHHVCVFQLGIEELAQRLNADGFETALSGHIGIENLYTTKFRYFDTRKELGFFLEITEYALFGRHSPPGERMISTMARLQKRFGGR